MSVNVLGQNVVTTWSRMKPPDFSMLSLSHAHLEAYRAAVNDATERSLLTPYHPHHPSVSRLGLPYNQPSHDHLGRDYSTGVSPWNVLSVDGARKLGQKVPVSIVTSSAVSKTAPRDERVSLSHSVQHKEESSRSKGKSAPQHRRTATESKASDGPPTSRDFAKCQLSKSQMNGLPDKISMTGTGGPSNADHLTWLTDVATGASTRGSLPLPHNREPSSPPGHQSVLSASMGGLAHPEGSDTGGSLFRPPIPSAPSTSDLYPAQFALPGPSHQLLHHRHSIGSESNLAAYYNHVNPHYPPYYASQYSPTGPYHQSSPGLVPQQFFPVDSFPSGHQATGIDGARVPGGHHSSHPSQSSSSQLPHTRSFAPLRSNSHTNPQSTYSSAIGPLSAKIATQYAPDSGATTVLYDDRRSLGKDRVPNHLNQKPGNLDQKTQLLNPLTLKLSGRPMEPSRSNGLVANRRESVGGVKSSLRGANPKPGSLRQRLARPGNITITEPPSSVLAEAPLSAPPLHSSYHSDIQSSKYPRLSTPSCFNQRQRSPLASIIKPSKDSNLIPPVPNYVPTTIDNKKSVGPTPLQFPAYFKKGSIIHLANNSLKRVEELTTKDFLQSASLSPNLNIDSSTVIKIEESPDGKSAILGFSVGHKKVKVSVETPLEHPFFVFKKSWSSCSPERSLQQYGLTCQKLKIDDVCVSLTHKSPKKGSTSQASPVPTSFTMDVSGPSKNITPSAAFVNREEVLASTSEAKSSMTANKREELPTITSPTIKVEDIKTSSESGLRKRRSSAPANLNLD